MKQVFLSIALLMGLWSLGTLHAQSTPGIVGGQAYSIEDMANTIFPSKQKRYDKSRNARLKEQNQRLERQIHAMQLRLDDCMGARTRYGKRRPVAQYDFRTDYWGERRIQKEYEQLQKENTYLREHYSWVKNELNECEARYYDDYEDYRPRRTAQGRDRGPQRDCCTHGKKAKKKDSCRGGKSKGRKYRYDDDDDDDDD
ncbi:MAG: hypothetical protein AAFR61_24910 [Bacteroidota bacterium]